MRDRDSTLSVLHLADLHLDSPLRGLEADAEAPAERLRRATRDAFVAAVDLALSEPVSLVLIAGDLFDGDWPDWRSGHFLAGQLHRLSQAGIEVVAIRGNHDAQSVLTRRLTLPERVRMLAAEQPDTVDFPALGIAVHGQSFATRAVGENLALRYPPPLPGRLNIGLLHTAAEGRGTDEGGTHERYAPCTVAQLASHGYDYWALGHVHARQVLSERPWVVFSGNIQGRHANETGAKGATLLRVRDRSVLSVEHRVLDVVRWEHLRVDLGGLADQDAAMAAVRTACADALAAAQQAPAPPGGRLLALRVTLEGATAVHAALMRDPEQTRQTVATELAAAGGAGAAWLEKVRLRTRPALDRQGLLSRPDALGLLARSIAEAPPEAVLAELQPFLAELLKVPGLRDALGSGHDAVRAAGGTLPPTLLDAARGLLLSRLAEL